MFYSITGKIINKDDKSVAVSCGAVAFKCFCTRNTLTAVSGKSGDVTLFTHLNVREDAIELFGFFTEAELEAFKLLTTVSGIGASSAFAVLSELTPDRLAIAVASGDFKSICAAKGIGQKIAQRIVMELKDKMSSAAFVSDDVASAAGAVSAAASMSNTSEAVAALVALGYTQSESTVAVSKLDPSLSVDELIKAALKSMMLRF